MPLIELGAYRTVESVFRNSVLNATQFFFVDIEFSQNILPPRNFEKTMTENAKFFASKHGLLQTCAVRIGQVDLSLGECLQDGVRKQERFWPAC